MDIRSMKKHIGKIEKTYSDVTMVI